MATKEKIELDWKIAANGSRSVELPDGTILATGVYRKGHDLAWAVAFVDGKGAVAGWTRYGGTPTRYQSIERQAMFDAEQAWKESRNG